MQSFPTSSRSFSATSLNDYRRNGKDHRAKGFSDDSSDTDSTYSLLSPIYHDSFASEEHFGADPPPCQLDTSAAKSEDATSVSSSRCEPPLQRVTKDMTDAERDRVATSLRAWEKWLVYKAKEDRLQIEQNAKQERIMMEKKQKEENEQLMKKIMVEDKIQQWLKIKIEQKKQDKLEKDRQEEEKLEMQRHKQRETEIKAAKKYKEWLRKKNHEKIEKEKREKEEKAEKDAKEAVRQQQAEEMFEKWLASTQDKAKIIPSSKSCQRADCFSNISYPMPSFYNPIPWKPVNIPTTEESAKKNTTCSKPPCQKKG